MISAMARHIFLPGTKRGRGNPNWGKPLRPLPALLTEFERQVERLGLTKAQYVASAELRYWCERNRNRCYVPEWLLEEWELTVEAIFSGVA
jgi:hypothetical protein